MLCESLLGIYRIAFTMRDARSNTLLINGGGQPVVDGLCGVFSAEPVHARSI